MAFPAVDNVAASCFIQFLLSVGYSPSLRKNQAKVQMAFLVFRIIFNRLTQKLLGQSQVALHGVNHRQVSTRPHHLRLEVKRGL